MRAQRRRLNPHLLKRVQKSGKTQSDIAVGAGFSCYTNFYEALRAEKVAATPQMIKRLERVADAVCFPKDQIFLDEAVAR